MNFLLGTLLIILFLFPGFLFRASYLNVTYGRSFRSSFIEELLFSLLPSTIIHGISVWFLILCLHFDTDGFYLLMINNPEAVENIGKWDIMKIIGYCIFTFIIGFWGGFLFRRYIVEIKNWDINIPIFRTRNEWYFVLSGSLLEVRNEKGIMQKVFIIPDEIRVDAIVEINKEAFIYRGVLHDFVLSKEDGLERLYLTKVFRRKLETETERQDNKIDPKIEKAKTKQPPPRLKKQNSSESEIDNPEDYYHIPGANLVLPYSEVKNLNIKYIYIEENLPELTITILASTTHLSPGETVDLVISINNVGTVPTNKPIAFTVTNYSSLTGLTVRSSKDQTVTIGQTPYQLRNESDWDVGSKGTFTSKPGVVIEGGKSNLVGIKISRANLPNQGSNGTVTQTVTIQPGSGGAEAPYSSKVIVFHKI